MTDYPYDPELPFAVIRIKALGSVQFLPGVIARFRLRAEASDFVDTFLAGVVELVDTTPKPKIPVDAEFIYWSRGPETVEYYARLISGDSTNKVWRNDEGEQLSEEKLLRDIDDAEVTVLVPRVEK